jgi:hypothetical protein
MIPRAVPLYRRGAGVGRAPKAHLVRVGGSTLFLAISLLNVLFDGFYHCYWSIFLKFRQPLFVHILFFVMTMAR